LNGVICEVTNWKGRVIAEVREGEGFCGPRCGFWRRGVSSLEIL
jgi:hypothetical protein